VRSASEPGCAYSRVTFRRQENRTGPTKW
jgi:hypothetical protein